jgi:hypothetical protein
MPRTKTSGQGHSASRSGKFEFDLTRQCLRSGTVQLPGSMLGLFEAGKVTLRDPDSEKTYSLDFSPPRRLGGLAEFFEQHSLEPNDKIIVVLDGESAEIRSLKRPPKRPQEPEVEGTTIPEASETTSELIVDGPVQVREVRRRKESDATNIPLFLTAETVPVEYRSPAVEGLTPGQQFDEVDDPGQEVIEPVLVPVEQGDLLPVQAAGATEQVMSFLADPSTSTILRVEDVSETLHLPGATALETLERLAQDPDSGLVTIRPGIYRMNRPVRS